MSLDKYSDSPKEAYKRITKGLIKFRETTSHAVAFFIEAKERKIWEVQKLDFKEWCIEVCGFTERWGHELLGTAKVVEGLKLLQSQSGNSLGFLDDLTPAHVAPIKSLPAPVQAAVLTTAQVNSGTPVPTPAAVRQAAADYQPTEPPGVSDPPPAPKDKMGYLLPEEVIALWNRGDEEILALVSHLSKAKKEIKDAYAKSDTLYHGFDCQGWMTDLEGVIYKLKCHRPYAVCPVCQGKLSKRCACCKGRGFVGKAYWEGPSVFVEMRKMRETMIAKQAA